MITKLENQIKEIIDELKGLCQTNGLSNQAVEEEIITSVFLYKFLSDKFIYNLENYCENKDFTKNELVNDDKKLERFFKAHSSQVALAYEQSIDYLITKQTSDEFYKIFDEALESISNNPHNDKFKIENADGVKEPLFTPISQNIKSSSKESKNNFIQNIFNIISKARFDFKAAFGGGFDFYSTIFEYLIKDYNVASGVYAEYFTPQAISKIIARILVSTSDIKDEVYDIYDPSAGSGSLILHLANQIKQIATNYAPNVYTQDISQKSTRFLRLNLLLNDLSSSLENLIKGDTLVSPAHFSQPHDPSSGHKKFDFITSNPPFKMDFSSTRDKIENSEFSPNADLKRFFAGIPNTPKNKKESMAIYLCFIQHILWSLNERGKAAIVVPTGFLTAQSSIEKKIREKLVNNAWLKGVISMPSNIFANTGTNVSVLFIDKENTTNKAILIDASKLGTQQKSGKNQRTILSSDEVELIENTFIETRILDDFSIAPSFDDIKAKNYSFSAGQYFDIKIEHIDISEQEFQTKITEFQTELKELFSENSRLEKEIFSSLNKLEFQGE